MPGKEPVKAWKTDEDEHEKTSLIGEGSESLWKNVREQPNPKKYRGSEVNTPAGVLGTAGTGEVRDVPPDTREQAQYAGYGAENPDGSPEPVKVKIKLPVPGPKAREVDDSKK